METTHSKNCRTKKPAPKIVVESWDDIWRSFKRANKVTTVEEMAKDGWRLALDVAHEIGMSKQGVFDLINSQKLESVKVKIRYSKKLREMTFVRPPKNQA